MRPATATAEDYVQWLIASPRDATMTEAARCGPRVQAHDAYRRLLLRLEPTSDELWREVEDEVRLDRGFLVLDDTTLDKPYGPKIELVVQHWSGKHRKVVDGINLITLLWTDGEVAIPIDYRIFNKKNDHKTKNDHFTEMLEKAQERGFQPKMVIFDAWYSSLANLKLIRRLEWKFLTCLKSNRLVSPVKGVKVHVSKLMCDESGVLVHLRGFGRVRVFQSVRADGDVKHWATNDLEMKQERCEALRSLGVWIEDYHRSLKQYCLVERCQARKERIQRNHVGLAIRAFVRLELHRFDLGLSIFELKRRIIRSAVQAYRRSPFYTIERLFQPSFA